jgi:hypothetical protein
MREDAGEFVIPNHCDPTEAARGDRTRRPHAETAEGNSGRRGTA